VYAKVVLIDRREEKNVFLQATTKVKEENKKFFDGEMSSKSEDNVSLSRSHYNAKKRK
jgi:hypothetical protein